MAQNQNQIQIDSLFFDKFFTVIDNLIKSTNILTAQTNELLEQQNIISTQQTVLLNAILQKPTILQAPQLATIELAQQTISLPKNIEILPKIIFDTGPKKWYILTRSQEIETRAAVPGQKKTVLIKGPIGELVSTAIPGATFDLAQIVRFKTTAPGRVKTPQLWDGDTNFDIASEIDVAKNDKTIIRNVVWSFEDKPPLEAGSKDFYFTPNDTIKFELNNRNSATTVFFLQTLFNLYKEVEITTVKLIIDQLRPLIS